MPAGDAECRWSLTHSRCRTEAGVKKTCGTDSFKFAQVPKLDLGWNRTLVFLIGTNPTFHTATMNRTPVQIYMQSTPHFPNSIPLVPQGFYFWVFDHPTSPPPPPRRPIPFRKWSKTELWFWDWEGVGSSTIPSQHRSRAACQSYPGKDALAVGFEGGQGSGILHMLQGSSSRHRGSQGELAWSLKRTDQLWMVQSGGKGGPKATDRYVTGDEGREREANRAMAWGFEGQSKWWIQECTESQTARKGQVWAETEGDDFGSRVLKRNERG